ncbi:transposase [Streptomyces sp. HC44]|uniref:Transposase n=1 Tax=Streptomyces scabichelini TaxID=2711217 RepID=A0A6G4V2N5_9ACTN|nr:transposase [Streptomyces scabichelini]
MIWRFKTGGQRRETPEEFGVWSTVHNRFRRWRDAGVVEALLKDQAAHRRKKAPVGGQPVSRDVDQRPHPEHGVRAGGALCRSAVGFPGTSGLRPPLPGGRPGR